MRTKLYQSSDEDRQTDRGEANDTRLEAREAHICQSRIETNQTGGSAKKHNDLLPHKVMQKIASEILEHTKQLGLFDELRMRLLEEIESSKEYKKLKSEFKREVDSFCSRADLSLPRAKLREKFSARTWYKTSDRIRDHVFQVSREHRRELRQLYEEHATQYLKARAEQQSRASKESPSRASVDLAAAQNEDEPPPRSTSSSSCSQTDSLADSGVSSTVSPTIQCTKQPQPTWAPTNHSTVSEEGGQPLAAATNNIEPAPAPSDRKTEKPVKPGRYSFSIPRIKPKHVHQGQSEGQNEGSQVSPPSETRGALNPEFDNRRVGRELRPSKVSSDERKQFRGRPAKRRGGRESRDRDERKSRWRRPKRGGKMRARINGRTKCDSDRQTPDRTGRPWPSRSKPQAREDSRTTSSPSNPKVTKLERFEGSSRSREQRLESADKPQTKFTLSESKSRSPFIGTKS